MQRDREWFVEQLGLAAEADGFTRIAGRVFGFLLLSDEPRSLDEIAEALGVSKASVSTDARRLLQRGVVQRVGRPGDRRDYYQIAPDFFARLTEHRVERWRRMRDLVAQARRRIPEQSPTVRDRFAYLDAMHDFLLGRVDGVIAAWAARAGARARAESRADGNGAARDRQARRGGRTAPAPSRAPAKGGRGRRGAG
ncbi:MAG: GbsR/MarR family transcriptional regulator [Gemmatimonadaceae bacterium]